MTAPPDVDIECSLEDELLAVLRADRWMTSAEVWERGKRWSKQAVRGCLRDMYDSSRIDGRIGGEAVRQVREYRKWK
jgi:hypothetical protein